MWTLVVQTWGESSPCGRGRSAGASRGSVRSAGRAALPSQFLRVCEPGCSHPTIAHRPARHPPVTRSLIRLLIHQVHRPRDLSTGWNGLLGLSGKAANYCWSCMLLLCSLVLHSGLSGQEWKLPWLVECLLLEIQGLTCRRSMDMLRLTAAWLDCCWLMYLFKRSFCQLDSCFACMSPKIKRRDFKTSFPSPKRRPLGHSPNC